MELTHMVLQNITVDHGPRITLHTSVLWGQYRKEKFCAIRVIIDVASGRII